MVRDWTGDIPEEEIRIYQLSGYGARMGFGARPALLVVDVTYGAVGDRRESMENSISRWRNSCGDVGWRAVDAIISLLTVARESEIPVFYSAPQRVKYPFERGRWGDKNRRAGEEGSSETLGVDSSDIPAEISPAPGELVVYKRKASSFFGTALISHLNYFGVDTLLVCGMATGGCVRASVVDAFSYDLRVSVVEEATFDRGELCHKVSLFEMDMKYADVVSLDETVAYLRHREREEMILSAGKEENRPKAAI